MQQRFIAFLVALAGIACATGAMTSPVALGAQTWYVDIDAAPGGDGLSWATAFNDLHAGLAAAITPGDEIWVAEGVYTPAPPNGDPSRRFVLAAGVALFGGFAGNETALEQRDWEQHLCVLSGDLNGDDLPDGSNRDDNARLVIEIYTESNGELRTSRVDGVSVVSGDRGVVACGLLQLQRGGIIVEHCTFATHSSEALSGAIYLYQGTAEIRDCRFDDNRITGNTSASGGALLANSLVSLSIIDCDFEANRAVGEHAKGGAVKIKDCGDLRLTACTFMRNFSMSGGGAIDIEDTVEVTIDRCLFKSNRAVFLGGAVWAHDCETLQITGSLFEDNATTRHSDSSGGALALYTPAMVRDCIFRENYSIGDRGDLNYDGGGAIRSYDLTVVDCLFEGNWTERCGGAIDGGGNTVIQRCRFVDNRAERYGGVIWLTLGDTATIEDCTFEGNRSDLYSLIQARYEGTLAVQRCRFSGNFCRTGLVTVDGRNDGVVALIKDTIFSDNTGTGLWGVKEAHLDVDGCRFIRSAPEDENRPAVLFLNLSSGDFVNTLIAGNRGRGRGAMEVNETSAATFTNCTLAENRDDVNYGGGIGAFPDPGPVVQFDNCILWNNGPDAIQGAADVNHTLAEQYFAGIGNVVSHPLFRNEAAGDFRLLPGSPAIDAADSDQLPPGTLFDLGGQPRFHDDEGSSNTGSGAPPYLDMGCHEFQHETGAFRVTFNRELFSGRPAQVIARGGTPNAPIYFFVSRHGTGETRIPILGATLNLAGPDLVGPQDLVTDDLGSAAWAFDVPNVRASQPIWIQAAQAANSSVVKWAIIYEW